MKIEVGDYWVFTNVNNKKHIWKLLKCGRSRIEAEHVYGRQAKDSRFSILLRDDLYSSEWSKSNFAYTQLGRFICD